MTKILKNFLASAAILMTTATAGSIKPVTAAIEHTNSIGILNVNRIITDATAAKAVTEQMNKLRKKAQDTIYARESELRAKETKLNEQQKKLSSEEFDKKKKAFDKDVAQLQRDIVIQNTSLQKAAQVAMDKIRQSVVDAASDIAKEKKFIMVLPSSFPVYYMETLDITDQVITVLNKKLPTVKVSVDSSKAKS